MPKKNTVEVAAKELAAEYRASGCSLEALLRGTYEKGIWYGRYTNTHTRELFMDTLIREIGGMDHDKARSPKKVKSH